MPLTNEEYVAKGGNYCPHCGSSDISGDEVEISAGQALQKVGCGECDAEWIDTYRLVTYQTISEPADPNAPEVIEYSVCEDCLLSIAHGVNDPTSAAEDEHLEMRMRDELDGREGHWVAGVPPSEVDPEGTAYEEFSRAQCELCMDGRAGSRHGVSLVIPKKEP